MMKSTYVPGMRTLLAIVAALACACLDLADAGEAQRSVVGVSANVAASAAFDVHLEAPPLVISRADIRRGYIEITVNSRFGMSTTRHAIRYVPGYLVEFVPRSDIFTSVLVMSPSPEPARVASAAPTDDYDERSRMVYRFQLAQNVAPGNYSWPVSVSVEM